jgi:glycosyltransferase involved in cell wall biosynthesis
VKVLLLTSRFAPHAGGGAERVVQTLAEQLLGDGHDVVVLTTAFEEGERDRVVGGVRVRVVPLRNVYDFAESSRKGLLKPLWHAIDSNNPFMKHSVANVLSEEKPDVLHSHVLTGFSPSAWHAARDCGIPIVHTLHDHYVLCARSSMAIDGVACSARHLDCSVLSVPRIRAARAVSAVVGVSDFILRRHYEFGAFLNVPSSVIANPCHLVGRVPKPFVGGGPLQIGYLGRIEANKGPQLLLDALSALGPDGWAVRLAGTGEPEYVDTLRRYPSEQVSFVGQVEPQDFLSNLDVLVVPSLVPETFGMSAAEALACGVPVVASTRGALPEIVSDGQNGFLFDPADPGALGSILRRLLTQREALSSMRSACRESAARFAPRVISREYQKVYASVAGECRRLKSAM